MVKVTVSPVCAVMSTVSMEMSTVSVVAMEI